MHLAFAGADRGRNASCTRGPLARATGSGSRSPRGRRGLGTKTPKSCENVAEVVKNLADVAHAQLYLNAFSKIQSKTTVSAT